MDRPDGTALGLTEFVDHFPSGVLITGIDHRIVYANAAILRMFGGAAEPGGHVGEDSRAILTRGKDAFEDPEGFVATTLAQETAAVEVSGSVFATVDGRVFERDYAPLRRGEELVAHIWTYRDVTEQHRQRDLLDAMTRAQAAYLLGTAPGEVFEKLLEAAIRFTHSRYGFIGEMLDQPDGSKGLRTHAISNIAWSPETDALYEQAKAEGFLFTKLDTLYGAVLRTGERVISNDPAGDERSGGLPPGHPALRAFVGIPLRKGNEFVGMIGLANRAGGYDDAVLEGAEPLMATITSILSAMREVRHAAEAERANRELEERVQKAHRLQGLSSLASGIAHDVNNVLATILPALSVLREEDGLSPSGREIVDDALEAALRGKLVVRDLMRLTRPSRRALDSGELADVIEEAVRVVRERCPPEVRVEMNAARPVFVEHDPRSLLEALVHLLANAVQALPEPKGTIRVTAESVEIESSRAEHPADLPPGRYAHIAIKDEGHGMPSEVADRAFDPFFTTAGFSTGPGLGLAVVHSVVTEHRGTTKIESEVGKGTTVHVYLPEVDTPKKAARGVHPDVPRGLTVLVVDDDPLVLRVTARVLERAGQHVIACTSGSDALSRVEADAVRPDLVLTDHQMPGMSGIELTTALRARGIAVPIVLMTGTPFGDRKALAAAGVSSELAKPVVPAQLIELLRRDETGSPVGG